MYDMSKVHHDESEGIRFGKLMAECYYYMGKHIFAALARKRAPSLSRRR